MTVRILTVAALALSMAQAAAPALHISKVGAAHVDAGPDAKAKLHTIAMGASALSPLDGSGNPFWPCYTGNAAAYPDCSAVPAGGLVLGTPEYYLPLSDCLASSSQPCMWLYYIVEDDEPSTTAELKYFVKMTQHGAVIFDTGTVLVGPNAGGVYVIAGNIPVGPGNCPSTVTCVAPVSGEVKISITVDVGKKSGTGETMLAFK